jgi:hypothetical protein
MSHFAPALAIPDAMESRTLPLRVKLRAVIGVERFVRPLLYAGTAIFLIGLILGPGRSGLRVFSKETRSIIAFGVGGSMIIIATLIWALTDYHYVLDRQARRILIHRGLRFLGRESPFLEAGDVAAIGLNCHPIFSKGGQKGWRYVPVLLLNNGGTIELARMETDKSCSQLFEFNWTTRMWASALQCCWIECPPQQTFQVRDCFVAVHESKH